MLLIIIFVVVLQMSTALRYKFDECAARVEFESAVDIGRPTGHSTVPLRFIHLSQSLSSKYILQHFITKMRWTSVFLKPHDFTHDISIFVVWEYLNIVANVVDIFQMSNCHQ
jgi:hypothetical protein